MVRFLNICDFTVAMVTYCRYG